MAVVTVSQLNNYMKRYVDNNPYLSNLYVKGEVSNFKKHYSGHIYMTLKDENSTIKAVMFKWNAASLKFDLENGMCVIACGKVSVYERDGQYQFYIESMTPDGVGELYVAYEQLKQKLEADGLFAAEHKKQIPKYPKKVGVVTSPTGAAVRDIINVITRRYRAAEIYIYPAQVQGIGAGETVASGIRFFNERYPVDVMIIGRGGGSIEDLWAFNEEIVARAVYSSEIPIISAVGHETDFTISDFVADLRAPTPSAAAEIAVPNELELRSNLKTASGRMLTSLDNLYSGKRKDFENLISRKIFSQFNSVIDEKRIDTDNAVKRLTDAFKNVIAKNKHSFDAASSKLTALNPMAVLTRGYSLASINNKTIKSANDVNVGDEIDITLNDGKIKCRVTNKESVK